MQVEAEKNDEGEDLAVCYGSNLAPSVEVCSDHGLHFVKRSFFHTSAVSL